MTYRDDQTETERAFEEAYREWYYSRYRKQLEAREALQNLGDELWEVLSWFVMPLIVWIEKILDVWHSRRLR